MGGADIYAERISKELVKRGHKIVIISSNPEKGTIIEKRGNIKIYRFHPLNISTFNTIGKENILIQAIWGLLAFYNLYTYKKVKEILKKEGPSVVHIHTPLFDIGLSVFDAVESLNLSSVLTLHDYIPICPKGLLLHNNSKICTNRNINPLCKIYREFSKRIVNSKPDIIISPSQFNLDIHKKNGVFKNSKTILECYGTELNDFDSSKDIKNANNKEKQMNVLYVGQLLKHKGVQTLVEAFKQIKNKNMKLHIVGGGTYENKLKDLSKDDERIIFHGKLPNEVVQKFYRNASISVVPSIWYDNSPLVIYESFRQGTPVIGSKMGGIPELIEDGYNGFLFEAGNVEQLRENLENSMENQEQLKELGKNARESVKKYEMSKHTERLIEIYKEAIEINRNKYN